MSNKVSIVVPCYNRKRLLKETLTSIKEQTYSNWECIVVDDRSTDNSLEVIKGFARFDNRFQLIVKEKNIARGAQQSRNIGLKVATGDYILFLDSDDLLSEQCLEQRISFMAKNPTADIGVFPGLRFYQKPYDNLTIISTYRGHDPIGAFLEFNIPWTMLNGFWRAGFLRRHQLAFDEKIMGFQDIDLHLSALFKGLSYAYADTQPDCFWRMQGEDSIGSKITSIEFVPSHLELVKKIYKNIEYYTENATCYQRKLHTFILLIIQMQLRNNKIASSHLFSDNLSKQRLLSKSTTSLVHATELIWKAFGNKNAGTRKLTFLFYKLLLLRKPPFINYNKDFLLHQYHGNLSPDVLVRGRPGQDGG